MRNEVVKVYPSWSECEGSEIMSVEEYTQECLSGDAFDRSHDVALECTVENQSSAIGRLLDILLTRKVIDESDIHTILNDSSESKIRTVEDENI